MAAAAAAVVAERRYAGSSGSDENDDDGAAAAAWNSDSADESDNEVDSDGAVPVISASRRKRYKRATSTGQKGAEGLGAKASQPIRRRILREDRRVTLEMLTSDDDVNAFQATRPSSYLEPATRRNLHETAPHLKSSFETLYNPEFNHLQVAPEILSSSSSESLASDTIETLPADVWQLGSGPKVASPYLDVSLSRRSAVSARMTPEEADRKDEHGEEGGRMIPHQQGATSGEIWTEFGGHSPAAVDGDWAAHAQLSRKSQPLNLSVRVSQPSQQMSSGAPIHSNGSIGVNVEIELSRSAAAAVAEMPITEKVIHRFEEPKQAPKLPMMPPQLPDKPAAASTRGRRVLPAVPDSADLEVSDLLRGDTGIASESTDSAFRPKSAVEILVPKGRCSSILQPQSSTVSQQLRSLFHNPSPHIMLHRAATQQTQPQPPQPARTEPGGSVELSKANQKYMPLRASHGPHQQHLQQPHSHDRSGRQSAVQMLTTVQQSASRSLMSTPQQPPELPQRHRQGSVPPSERIRQEALHPTASSQTAFLNNLQFKSQVPYDTSSPQVRPQPHRASPHAYSRQRYSPSPAVPHEISRLGTSRGTAVNALFNAQPSQSRASPVDPKHASSHATSRALHSSPLRAAPYETNQNPAQAPPVPPRRARQTTDERQPMNMRHLSQPQPAVEQLYRRVLQAPEQHRMVTAYQPKVPPPDEICGSGENDSGCCQSSSEYLIAKETTAAAVGSQTNQTRIQTNPRTGRAAAPPEPEQSQPPCVAHLPPNAVRVLPSLSSLEVGELRRLLAARRERAEAAVRGREPTEDAIAGLERMCRDMRLHDDQLLDGAERRDTAIRVQARLEALRDSQNLLASSVPRSSASTREWEINDQSLRLQVASGSGQRNTIGTSATSSATVAPRSESYLRMFRTGSRQQHQIQDQVLLQPGEQESGPEVIL